MSRGGEMRPAGVKLTYDDFVLFPDDGMRHELVNGEHYVTPSPSRKHQSIAWNLNRMIGVYLEHQRVGRAFQAPFDVILTPFDVVEPDLLFISTARLAMLTDANVQGAPDLVVEISSPGSRTRDDTIKLRLYERSGVEEYWVIDPELDVVKIYRRAANRLERVSELALERGDTLTTPLMPGLELPLAKIFED